MVLEVENFHGVYLLFCTNPKYKGRTYIGYTVDPRRRVTQHNKGSKYGGARRTSGKGPWDMVLIVYGFPSDIAALRFEWAWQHPNKSRRLKHVTAKKSSEKAYDYRLRVMANMLSTSPWCRLPLTVQWLKQEYRKDFPVDLQPPSHIPIGYGPIRSKKVKKQTEKEEETIPGLDDLPSISSSQSSRCEVCIKKMKPGEATVECVYPHCGVKSHMICLAKLFLHNEPSQLIPVEGTCPRCKGTSRWGDLIRKKQGCYADLVREITENEDFASHWAEELHV
ncbi:Structure-specific endonuclease subunit slx1 [Holothuria leucospilota]|uniref:Structure-specific endonuclease subunit SLX1 homolog n=1 Tax=Holothuria leucospilota TaxID=206669 RepID=A0A9Q1CBT7_HOLLE|nr:Structure-specific endonuclease subunit slx1 [Holothuria leucospilota]